MYFSLSYEIRLLKYVGAIDISVWQMYLIPGTYVEHLSDTADGEISLVC
jgi:hypothetical protein